MKFSVGDIVRIGKGKAEWRIVSTRYGERTLKQVGGCGVREDYLCNLTLLRTKEQDDQMKKEKEMTSKLYQIKDTETFVVQIGVNQEGKAVVETKGTGEIKVVDKATLVEVVPYTISVRNIVDGIYKQFITKPGAVNLEDVLIIAGKLYTVEILNTKAGDARDLPANAQRLVSAPI